jgi:hypothetical protein
MRLLAIAALAAFAAAQAPLVLAASSSGTVICKDGTTSAGGQGACSGHGGIDKKATAAKAKEHKGKASKESKEKKTKPAASTAEATVKCKDGTTSKGGQGACSGHGGIDKGGGSAAPAAAPAAAKPARPAAAQTSASDEEPVSSDASGAIAKCNDGSYSHAKVHTGACSRHGGVAQWLDKGQ